jgi:hypothetical protein
MEIMIATMLAYTTMEYIVSLLAWIGLLVGVPLIVLVIHSIQFDTWNENFSKKGLKRHAKELIVFLLIGGALMVGWEILKSTFTKKK